MRNILNSWRNEKWNDKIGASASLVFFLVEHQKSESNSTGRKKCDNFFPSEQSRKNDWPKRTNWTLAFILLTVLFWRQWDVNTRQFNQTEKCKMQSSHKKNGRAQQQSIDWPHHRHASVSLCGSHWLNFSNCIQRKTAVLPSSEWTRMEKKNRCNQTTLENAEPERKKNSSWNRIIKNDMLGWWTQFSIRKSTATTTMTTDARNKCELKRHEWTNRSYERLNFTSIYS